MKPLNYQFILMIIGAVMSLEIPAFAEGTARTIGVSCVIPAIPGVNAPLDEKQTPEKQKSVVREQKSQPQQENQQEPSSAITEDTRELRTTEQAETPQLMPVKTSYSR